MRKMGDSTKRKASIKSVLTCALCKKLCRQVTIIEECYHRFCKKCLTRKITEEKLKVCPVCNLDLGASPLQKIRADHQVQAIRDIFSSKRKEHIERGQIQDKPKNREPKKLVHKENDNNNRVTNMLIDSPLAPPPPPAPTSSRRKEKLISSLVNKPPPIVVDQFLKNQQNASSSSSGRRRVYSRNANKNAGQDSSRFSNVVYDQNNQIREDDVQLGSSTIPILSGKATQNYKQQVESIAYAAESSKKNKSIEPLDGMKDLLAPLNKLVTKGVTLDKSKAIEPVPKFPQVLINLDDDDDEDDDDDDEDEEYVPFPKSKEHKFSKQYVEQKSNVVQVAPPSSSNDKGKGKKGRRGRKKKEINSNIPPLPPPAGGGGGDGGGGGGGGGGSNNVGQVKVTEAAPTSSGTKAVMNKRANPIWFHLVACDKQDCPLPLPQISSRFIRIKDVTVPSSYIKKYLARTLSLQSEDEVEVRMLGMPIRPALPMQHLVDLWLRAAPLPISEKKAKIGGSAEDFVMVLKYARSRGL